MYNVLDYCSLYSDAHNAVCLSFNFHGDSTPEECSSNEPSVKLWDKSKSSSFNENIDHVEIECIDAKLDTLDSITNLNKNHIDDIVNCISNILLSTSEK